MQIGIVGLGLIGSSMARALKAYTDHLVLGLDAQEDVMEAALAEGAVDGRLTEDALADCDVLLIALYPAAAVQYVQERLQHIRPNTLVLDLCGVKEAVAVPLTALAKERGFRYIGGHPMAGTERSGYFNGRADLFQGASMILIPCCTDEAGMAVAGDLMKQIGFAQITHSTIREHDRIIAYTSQLAHVVSNAYVKSPAALLHHGFSAGSYRDLTRVARLNEDMWTELFLDNRSALAEELDGLIERLSSYRDAIAGGRRDELHALLKEGRERKEQIDRGKD